MDVSIIIVSWNVRELLKKCLSSIYSHTNKINFELFVVDNASDDGTVDFLQKKFPQIHLIANTDNLGFAKANNQAIKQALGKYILLLNPDTELIEPSIEKIFAFMEKNSDIDIAGCQLINADNSIQSSVRRFPTLYSSLIQLLKLHHVFNPKKILKKYLHTDFNYSQGQIVDQVMGAFLMYKKELGLLDDNFYLWFEEVDLCKRAKKVFYTPITRVIHHGNSSFKQITTAKKQKYFYQSLCYYFKKYGL